MNSTFYSLWRDTYLRGLIRAKVVYGFTFDVTCANLKEFKDLSVLSYSNKLDNAIVIKLDVKDRNEFISYLCNPFRNVVNYLNIEKSLNLSAPDNYTEKGSVLDCDIIPQDVNKISFYIDEVKLVGTFSHTITELEVKTVKTDPFRSLVLDGLVSNLPSNLKSLVLPPKYDISTECVLPATLCDLTYASDVNNFKRFVFPSNKVFKNAKVSVYNESDIDWLSGQPQLTSIVLQGLLSGRLTQDLLPSHVKSLSILCNIDVDIGALPVGLEWLHSRFYLPIGGGMLPPNLQYLSLPDYEAELEVGLLPESLKFLEIKDYLFPLKPNVLPAGLNTLSLDMYNYELKVGDLPISLTELNLALYDQPLKPNILPEGLKKLNFYDFRSQVLEQDSLPNSLVELYLNIFKGSFEPIGALNHLKKYQFGL